MENPINSPKKVYSVDNNALVNQKFWKKSAIYFFISSIVLAYLLPYNISTFIFGHLFFLGDLEIYLEKYFYLNYNQFGSFQTTEFLKRGLLAIYIIISSAIVSFILIKIGFFLGQKYYNNKQSWIKVINILTIILGIILIIILCPALYLLLFLGIVVHLALGIAAAILGLYIIFLIVKLLLIKLRKQFLSNPNEYIKTVLLALILMSYLCISIIIGMIFMDEILYG